MTNTPEPPAGDCTCADACGEDPDCTLHGIETDWSLENRSAYDWRQLCVDYRDMHQEHEAALSASPAPSQSGLVEALTPSGATKYAYSGEFKWQESEFDEDGNEITVTREVPWTTIKEIMAAILSRANDQTAPDGLVGELTWFRNSAVSLRGDAIGLRFYVFHNNDGRWHAYTEGFAAWRDVFDSEEAAKKGAQAEYARRILSALTARDNTALREAVPKSCDGVEQDAFEAWAKSQNYNMDLHPLHWLFLDKITNAARQGWKAGLEHASSRIDTALAGDA